MDAAIQLARGQQAQTNATVNNGRKEVPSFLHEPVAVDKDNMLQTVVKDGYHKLERICEGLPADKCPRGDSAAVPGANKEQ